MKAHTDEFYKLSIREGMDEDEVEKVARYLGGLRFNIQDELVIANPKSVEDCFQLALRAEEKVKRRQEKSTRGGGNNNNRGRGAFPSQKHTHEDQGDTRKGKEQSFSYFRGGFGNNRGRFGRSSNQFSGRCYNCNEYGHPSFKYPKKTTSPSSKVDKRVAFSQEEEEVDSSPREVVCNSVVGENLMIKKTILKTSQGHEPIQRRSLFRIRCQCEGKVYNIIVDFGSTDNMVSTEMVEKLNLERIPHKNPYRFSLVNDDVTLLVKEQAKVDFRAGQYKDSV